MDQSIKKADALRGTLRVPGDKSIAHRSLILGALARGRQTMEGLPPSADVASTAACLRTLGCTITMDGNGNGEIVAPDEWLQGSTLDAGNSGTTTRLLAGLAAGAGIDCVIDGDRSLRKRPMKRIAEPLTLMGAEVLPAPEGGLPMQVRGAALRGIRYAPPAASAQVKSAVLIAGLFASGATTVVEKAATRDHTELMLQAMGVAIERSGLSVTVQGGVRPEGVHVAVPADISSALFFITAALIVPGSEVRLLDVGLNPTRTGALAVLKRMGAKIEVENTRTVAGEPMADLIARSSGLRGVRICGPEIPTLIDELPILAVAATQAEGETVVRDAAELRHKESDRIESVVENLTRLGARIEAFEDGFRIEGPTPLRGAPVDSLDDHRIAMAMTVAGLAAVGETRIAGSDVASVSYPEFYDDLRRLVEKRIEP